VTFTIPWNRIKWCLIRCTGIGEDLNWSMVSMRELQPDKNTDQYKSSELPNSLLLPANDFWLSPT
jgi:hypothetical protein